MHHRNRQYYLIAVLLLTVLVLADVAISQTSSEKLYEDTMSNQIGTVTNLLAGYEKSNSIAQLEGALRAVERITPRGAGKTSVPGIVRREQTITWLRLLAIIDRHIETNYDNLDPTNVIELNLVPPVASNGMVYPSGVDPNDIKDPVARAKYEAALAENRNRAARAVIQTRLRRIDRLASLDVQRYLQTFYASSTDDQKELRVLFGEAKLSSERIMKLGALFDGNGKIKTAN